MGLQQQVYITPTADSPNTLGLKSKKSEIMAAAAMRSTGSPASVALLTLAIPALCVRKAGAKKHSHLGEYTPFKTAYFLTD